MSIDGYGAGDFHFNMLDESAQNRMIIDVTPDERSNIDTTGLVPVVKEKKKGRPKKSEKRDVILAEKVDEAAKVGPVTIMTDEAPVYEKYQETNNMLHHTIMQVDQLATETKQALDTLKSTRNVQAKTKYDAITGMTSTLSNLLSTKINAIRELNKSINDANMAEIRRFKEIGDRNAEKSADERIAELYNAYLTMPVGTYQNQGPHFAPIVDATTGMVTSVPMGASPVNPNITPELNRMMIGDDPNINTVVVHDPTTNMNYFDVIDKRTGQSVPNFPRPSQMVMDGITIKHNEGIAVNRDMGIEYDVIERPSMPEYVSDPNANQVYKDMMEGQGVVRKATGSNKDQF